MQFTPAKNHLILQVRSFVTRKNVSWPRLIRPTL